MEHAKKNGFTLIELILVTALLAIVAAAAFSIMIYGNKVFALSTREYDLQDALRKATEATNNNVRYASAVFTIPSSTFPAHLTDEWNYFGLQIAADGGTELASYTWNTATRTHDKTVIVPSQKNNGITYALRFEKHIVGDLSGHEVNQGNLLWYKLDVLSNGTIKNTIETEIESLNAQQVVDQVHGTGVAIAYRMDERAPLVASTTSVRAQVAMILDKSGSMSDNMDDESSGIPVSSTKMKIMQRVSKELVSKLARQNNIDISLVPFSDNANYPRDFLNAYANITELNSEIESMSPGGGTNTGDGLRRGYWRLVNNKSVIEQQALAAGQSVLVSNYVIILSDGETTFHTRENISGRPYYTGEGRVDGSSVYVSGPGDHYDATSVDYSLQMIDRIKAVPNLKAYVVGFITDTTERTSITQIASAFGVEPRFASSSFELEQIFTDIHSEISAHVWYLQGPKIE